MHGPSLTRFGVLLALAMSARLAEAGTVAYQRTDLGLGGSDPRGVGIGALNSGASLDLVTANEGSNSVSILLGGGGGAFGGPEDFTTGAGPVAVRVADVDHDGRADVVTANAAAGTVSVLIGDGSGGLDGKRDFAAGAGVSALAIADVNGDGNLDLLAASATTGVIFVLRGDGNGGFASPSSFTTAGAVDVIAVDINQDGKPDMVTPNGAANSLSVRLNTTPNGSSTVSFSASSSFATGSNPRMAVGADLNGDGKQDLVTTNAGNGTSTLLRNTTAPGGSVPSFVAWPAVTSGAVNGTALAIGDLNVDGKQDLVVMDRATSRVLVMEGNGAGGFAPAAAFDTDTEPRALAIADLSADALPDLVTANFSGNDVSVLLGGFLIQASASVGGAIDPSGDVLVSAGANVTFAITPEDYNCYATIDVTVDGASVGPVTSYTFPNVHAGHTISATFAEDLGQHTITATADYGGDISPSGAVPIACYDYTPFTITPSGDYSIQDVEVDGVSVGPVGYYPFQHVTSDHTIHAIFRRIPSYDIIDLGPAGSSASVADDISGNSNVAGSYRDPANHYVPFAWSNGSFLTIPTLGGTSTWARAIDDSGHVCGGGYLPGGSTLQPFLYNGTTTTQLPLLAGGTTGEAVDLNGQGRVVGYNNNTAGASRAVYWDQGGAPVDLGLLPNGYAARAVAVNAAGWILGQCTVFNTNEGSDHVFIWRNGVLQDLTEGEYGTHVPLGFDDSGRVVGYDQGFAGGLFYKYPFVIEADGTRLSLPLLSGYQCGWATSVNGSGQIVGYSGWPWSGGNSAVLYQDGVIRELTSLLPPGHGWFLNHAYSINDAGEIVGDGVFQGATHAFLLRPSAPSAVDPMSTPVALDIASIWPNPARAGIHIRYSAPSAAGRRLSAFDISGRLVRSWTLEGTAGAHEALWDGTDAQGIRVPAGIYWIKLDSALGSATRSVVLLR